MLIRNKQESINRNKLVKPPENPPVYEKPEVGLKRLKLTQICQVMTF